MLLSCIVAITTLAASSVVQASPCPFQHLHGRADSPPHVHSRDVDMNTAPTKIALSDYTAQTADQKHSFLMKRIQETAGVPGHLNSQIEILKAVIPSDNNWIMNDWPGLPIPWPPKNIPDDEIPFPFQKGIHAVGECASAEWVPAAGHSYTGVFASGAKLVVRFSLAAPASEAFFTKRITNITPGLGLKALRTGVKSGNLVAMFSLGGQADTDFFKNVWNNHVPKTPATLIPIETAFRLSTRDHTNKVGLSDFATFDKEGKKADKPNFPYMISFVPTKDAPPKQPDADTNPLAWRAQVGSIKPNTTLWTITAQDRPDSADRITIGTLLVTSTPATSKYCDDRLLFRHQRFDDDMKIRGNDWRPACANIGEEFECRALSSDPIFNTFNDTVGFNAPVNTGLPWAVHGLPDNFSDAI
ncbi:hypothetical protein HDU97_007886 [Phlyctochytrium planicorne]|nr:hypothetical protein HDU97_007886 [Phlyctochytrium planicorne]